MSTWYTRREGVAILFCQDQTFLRIPGTDRRLLVRIRRLIIDIVQVILIFRMSFQNRFMWRDILLQLSLYIATCSLPQPVGSQGLVPYVDHEALRRVKLMVQDHPVAQLIASCYNNKTAEAELTSHRAETLYGEITFASLQELLEEVGVTREVDRRFCYIFQLEI